MPCLCSDFDEDELAQLAGSADEGDSEEENSSDGEMEMDEEDDKGSDVGGKREKKNSNIETKSDSEMDQEDIVEDFEFSDEDDD